MKSTKSYLINALLLFGTLLLVAYVDFRLQLFAEQDYRVLKWLMIRQFLYIPVGVALALPYFLQTFKKNGDWKVDYKKIIFFGIPSLYFTLYFGLHFLSPISVFPMFIISRIGLYKLGGTIFGYVLVTSFFKTEGKKLSF